MISRTCFAEDGYLGPVRILDSAASRRFLAEAMGSPSAVPLDWNKGYAAASRPYYALACHPAILEVVTALLGNDVILWGASLVRCGPGAVHPWHSDVESAHPDARTVAVWLGLKNCCAESSLLAIPGSHRHGVSIQELRARHSAGCSHGLDQVLAWARERASSSTLETLVAHDGEAVFFDGRLWHGSDNRSGAARTALLLQYATPDTPIRVPAHYDWPFRFLARPLPPCVLVSGEDRHGVNRIVPGPVASGPGRGPRLTSQARPLALPLVPDDGQDWKPFPIFHGTTAGQRSLSCHVSALRAGHSPHPPHRHDEEELLVVLEGEAEVVFPDLPPDQQRQRMRHGDFVYYPAQFAHTLEGVSPAPVNYLMLKWLADPTGCATPIGFGRYDCTSPEAPTAPAGFQTRRVFEGPTRWLHKLHCHTSTLAPGAGYEPHVDAYDVAIIVLEGTLESLGQRLARHGVFFYAAGEPHGAHNPGSSVTRYVVFEFHARPTNPSDRPAAVPLLRKLADPRAAGAGSSAASPSACAGRIGAINAMSAGAVGVPSGSEPSTGPGRARSGWAKPSVGIVIARALRPSCSGAGPLARAR